MEQLSAQLQDLNNSLKISFQVLDERMKKLEASSQPNQVSNMNSGSEEPEDWDVLPDNLVDAQKPSSLTLINRLQTVPTSSQLEKLRNELPHYRGVPRTPPPTRSFEDKKLCKLQGQVEDILNLLIHLNEKPEVGNISHNYLLALGRRLFEDLHENRRNAFARGHNHILRRAEDDVPHLLQPEEEKALRESRRSSHRGGRQRRSFSLLPSTSALPGFSEDNNQKIFRGRSPFRNAPFRGGKRGGGRFGGGRSRRQRSRSQ